MVKLGMSSAGGKTEENGTCQVFLMETSNMTENFTAPYMPKEEAYSLLDEENIDRDIHVVNPNSLNIENYRGIPSSMNLMLAEAASSEELTRFKKK